MSYTTKRERVIPINLKNYINSLSIESTSINDVFTYINKDRVSKYYSLEAMRLDIEKDINMLNKIDMYSLEENIFVKIGRFLKGLLDKFINFCKMIIDKIKGLFNKIRGKATTDKLKEIEFEFLQRPLDDEFLKMTFTESFYWKKAEDALDSRITVVEVVSRMARKNIFETEKLTEKLKNNLNSIISNAVKFDSDEDFVNEKLKDVKITKQPDVMAELSGSPDMYLQKYEKYMKGNKDVLDFYRDEDILHEDKTYSCHDYFIWETGRDQTYLTILINICYRYDSESNLLIRDEKETQNLGKRNKEKLVYEVSISSTDEIRDRIHKAMRNNDKILENFEEKFMKETSKSIKSASESCKTILDYLNKTNDGDDSAGGRDIKKKLIKEYQKSIFILTRIESFVLYSFQVISIMRNDLDRNILKAVNKIHELARKNRDYQDFE